jgi:hypothetical protein
MEYVRTLRWGISLAWSISDLVPQIDLHPKILSRHPESRASCCRRKAVSFVHRDLSRTPELQDREEKISHKYDTKIDEGLSTLCGHFKPIKI